MSTVKTFTLHENYKDFKPSQTEISLETLVPYSAQGPIGCLLPLLMFAGLMFITCIATIYHETGVPLLFQHFSQETVAQVIVCQVSETKPNNYVLQLAYSYTWNSRPLVGQANLYGHNPEGCASYLNQTIAIRVLEPDPNQTRIAAQMSPAILLTFIAVVMGGFGAYGVYLFLYVIILRIRVRFSHPRLTRAGILLEGEILSVRGYSPNKTRDYVVLVKYGFETPRKKYLKGYVEAKRNDLSATSLPPVGTPVAILYADDHAHMML
jgi:hypothetical protein